MEVVHFTDLLTDRDRKAIEHALMYEDKFSDANVPGHSAFLLIAKLYKICSDLQDRIHNQNGQIVKKIAYDNYWMCWRDVETGIKIEP